MAWYRRISSWTCPPSWGATKLFVVPAWMPVRLPEDLDPVLGVFNANLETALNVVHDTPVRLGETALIIGDPALRVRMFAAAPLACCVGSIQSTASSRF